MTKIREIPLEDAVEALGATGLCTITRRPEGKFLTVERENGIEDFLLTKNAAGMPVVIVPTEEADL